MKQESSNRAKPKRRIPPWYPGVVLALASFGLGVVLTLAWTHNRAIQEAEALQIARPLALQYCVDHFNPSVCKDLKLLDIHDATPGPTDSRYHYGNWLVSFRTSRHHSIDVALDRRGDVLQVGQGFRNLWDE